MQNSNKVVLLSGGTGGIGEVVLNYLANNNYTILLSARNINKAKFLKDKYPHANITLFECDLFSIKSVEKFIENRKTHLNNTNNKIEILINNAGVIANSYVITEDGYESTKQINYISQKLLTNNLLEYIDGGKIINTLSLTNKYGKKLKKNFNRLNYYSNSKYLFTLYTKELAKNHPNIIVCGADPGIVNTGIIRMNKWFDPITDLFFRPLIKSAAQGAVPIINAIKYSSKDNDSRALFFRGSKISILR